VCSCTDHRGGKITKSAIAVPGFNDGHVSTVKIDGSYRKQVLFHIEVGTQKTYDVINGDGVDHNEFS
jgi:hypothetical protein